MKERTKAGWVLIGLLPFMVVGYILGYMWTGFYAGFRSGHNKVLAANNVWRGTNK